MKKRYSLTIRLSVLFARLLFLTLFISFGTVYFVLTDLFEKLKREELQQEMSEWKQMYKSQKGLELLQAEFNSEVSGEGEERVLCRLYAPDGLVLLSTSVEKWWQVPRIPADLKKGQTVYREFEKDKRSYLMIFSKLEDGAVFNHAISFKEDKKFLMTYRTVAVWALCLSILLALPLIISLVRREIRGVDEVATAARGMSQSGEFNHQVPEDWKGLEVYNLATSFNMMQRKISSLIADLKDVSNNIAHDMRSPLTRMRGIAETTLTGSNQSTDAYQQMGGAVVEECDRLISMVSTMLAITEVDASELQVERLDLTALVEEASDIFEAAAEIEDQIFTKNLPNEPVYTSGNKSQLQRALANLLDNACKYTKKGGSIHCVLAMKGSEAVITVQDTGVGIDPKEHEAIFERFYRCDRSRSNYSNGLGLSYVKASVNKHGGTIKVESEAGVGSKFMISLPIV